MAKPKLLPDPNIAANLSTLMAGGSRPHLQTQPALAKASGVGQSTVGRILRGEVSPGSDSLRRIADAFGVDVGALYWDKATFAKRCIAGELPAPTGAASIDLDRNPEYPAIRRVSFRLSAGASGFQIEPLEEDEPPIVFRREWFERNRFNPAKLFAVRVINGSMEPGLYSGDTVVVNTEDAHPRDGQVYAVNFEGDLVIKRLVRDDGRWWLKSDNPDQARYPRKVVGEGVFVIGRIVHKQSEHI